MTESYSAVIMDDQAADETVSTVIGPAIAARMSQHIFYAKFATGTTSGVVTIESADDPAYTGTWASEGTITFAGTAPNVLFLRVAGCALALRARISTVIAGGGDPGVTVTYLGTTR